MLIKPVSAREITRDLLYSSNHPSNPSFRLDTAKTSSRRGRKRIDVTPIEAITFLSGLYLILRYESSAGGSFRFQISVAMRKAKPREPNRLDFQLLFLFQDFVLLSVNADVCSEVKMFFTLFVTMLTYSYEH